MNGVERVGVSFEPELLHRFDAMMKKKGYGNRSQAIADILRQKLMEEQQYRPSGRPHPHCKGGLTR